MGIMNYFKIGGKHYAYTDKPKLTQREALKQIYSMIGGVELTDGPVTSPAERQHFEKINVSQYTDAQVTAILKRMKAIVNEKK
jgi:hypothetical protein